MCRPARLCILLCACFLYAATFSPAGFAAHSGKFRVGIHNFPPLSRIDAAAFRDPLHPSSGRGLFIEILEDIARREQWNIEFVPDTLPRLIERLNEGDVDMIVAVSPSNDLAHGLEFSRETVISTWARVYARPRLSLESPTDLASRAVGLVRDDPYNSDIRSTVRRLNAECTFVEFPNYHDLLDALQRGWIEAGVVDRLYAALNVRNFTVEATPLLFSPIELRFATRPGARAAEMAALDYHLDAMKHDPDSLYYRLIDQYLSLPGDNKLPRAFVWGLVASTCLLLFLGIVSMVLRLQVRHKTIELTRELEQRKTAERELARLAMVIKQAADAVIIADPDGRVEYVNPAFEIETNLARHEVTGQPLERLAARSPLCKVARSMLRLTVEKSTPLIDRFPLNPTDTSGSSIEAAVSLVRDESGRVRNHVITLRNVTRETQLEAQLRQAQKMEAIGTLSGGIAHDFNNLLVPIMGYAELLVGSADGRTREYPAKILAAATRARDLVRQILAFSRQSEEERKTLDLAPLVHEAVRLLQASLPATIEIREKIDPDCGCILGDASQIHQIVMNLGTNAYHAMRETGGTLDIAIAPAVFNRESIPPDLVLPPGSYLRLTIEDTGHGMDQSVLSRIFDPYFTTKAPGDGTGLGLSIVHGIVHKHDGHIAVKSQVGVGTRFDVYFPAANIAPQDDDTSIAAQPLGPISSHILVVDDEEHVALMEREMLCDLGYRVSLAIGSTQAIELLRKYVDRFDLIITDQNMPVMSGLALIAELRQLRREIPAILCTGYSDAQIETRALELGIRFCVRKPFSRAEMAHAVFQTLRTAANSSTSNEPANLCPSPR